MPDQPNFLIFLTDDQGHGDLGCYGGDDLQTPNVDGLAASGARFTHWYSNGPVCSAARASLLTGRYPHRVGVPGNVSHHWDASGLSREATTLPEALKPLGYQSYMSGKWHLGQWAGERPHERGFDDWFGHLYGCIDFYSHTFYWLMSGSKLPPRHDLWHNDEELIRYGQYMTDLIADEAIHYLHRAKVDGRPFLLYVPFNAPHYPLQAPRETLERFAHLDLPRQLIAAMLWCYDQAVGRILHTLEELGFAENTVVFSSADHGPSREPRNWPDGREDPFPGGSTAGLRGEKFAVYEGGIRLPGIMRWPGRTTPEQTIDTVACHFDVFPTLLKAAGGDPSQYTLEGSDIGDVIAGRSDACPHEGIGWSLGHGQAYREGPWKLVRHVKPEGGSHPPELYHLDEDPGEQHNLADEYTERVDQLTDGLEAWLTANQTTAC